MSFTSVIATGVALIGRAFFRLLNVGIGNHPSPIELRTSHVVEPVLHIAARDQVWYRRSRTGKPLRY